MTKNQYVLLSSSSLFLFLNIINTIYQRPLFLSVDLIQFDSIIIIITTVTSLWWLGLYAPSWPY